MTKKYAVLIEQGASSYGAYVPDLPGCVAAADTMEATLRLIREAIEFHIQGMLLHGEAVPEATTGCIEVEIDLERIAEATWPQR